LLWCRAMVCGTALELVWRFSTRINVLILHVCIHIHTTLYQWACQTNSTIFWGTMPCNPLTVSSKVASRSFHTSFLLGLLFDPEDVGAIFLRNVSRLSMDYTTLYPRRKTTKQKKTPWPESASELHWPSDCRCRRR
jgi:hypothetical protein